ncbi:Hsp70 family protein [Nocardia sp. X0981]
MTSGLGIGIGTVNVVSARITGQNARPVVRTRRTAVGFDSGGTARLGGITRFSTAVNEFADLGRDPDSVYVDGRIFSPTTIFASVVQGMVAAEPAAAVVATHPAGYTAKQLDLLRQSLDLAGAGHVQLVPEPVAAVHWLETEHGPLDSGFVLVYDLGGNSLDVAVVRTGPDWPHHPLVGTPIRSYEFGGRPLGALIARCAGDRAIGPAAPGTGAVSLVSFVNPEGLRREHVRDSLEVVRAAVRAAGVALSDIGRVLVVGGAARPPQVAETLAELGLPVTVAADSGQCVALGAAGMAADSIAPTGSARLGHPPIFSGAALFSAVAMSAATILGNGAADPALPEPERPPLRGPGAVLYEIHGEAQVERSESGWSVSYAPLGAPARIAPAGVARLYGPPIPGRTDAPAQPRIVRPAPPGRYGAPPAEGSRPGTHDSDPARFHTPGPFGYPGIPLPAQPGTGPDGPGSPDADEPDDGQPDGGQSGGEQSGGGQPGGEQAGGGQSGGGQPGGGQPGGGQPGGGQPGGGQPGGGQPGGGQPGGEQPGGEQAGGGQPGGEQAGGGQPGGEQAGGGQSGGGQPGGGQSGGGQPGGGQSGGGQPGGGTDTGHGPGAWSPEGGGLPGPAGFGAPGGDRPGGGGWSPGHGWSPPGGTAAPRSGMEGTGVPGAHSAGPGMSRDGVGGPSPNGGYSGPGGPLSGGGRPDSFGGYSNPSSSVGPGGFGGPGGNRLGGASHGFHR